MKLTILGCHSALPKLGHNVSAQILEIQNEIFLIDCGEGTQVLLRKNKIKFSRIKNIFISHLHGDHYFGLVGLISTFSLLNRTNDLNIYGPLGIKDIIVNQLKAGSSWTNFKLNFHELKNKHPQIIFKSEFIEVSTIPLKHRIYTNGFIFKEINLQKTINQHAAEIKKINIAYYNKLKQGYDVFNELNEKILNSEVTFDSRPTKSYAYCSDTQYDESIIEQLKNCSVLYHESTFLDKHIKLAKSTKHSTAKQAAMIAKKASVELLILGHYSSRYNSYQDFLNEAKLIFNNVILSEDNKIINI